MRAGSLAALLLAGWAGPASALDCVTRPELCNRPVTSELNQPDLSLAIDVVFVGDGFPDGGAFASQVDALISGLKGSTDAGVVSLEPSLFNFHRVDVDGAPFNVGGGGFSFVVYDANAVSFAAAENAPDVDVVVLLANVRGRANAAYPTQHTSGGRLVIAALDPSAGAILNHELGHALFQLADEYVEGPKCGLSGNYASTEPWLLRHANVTSMPSGEKFARASPPLPLHEGGYYCERGIWRTADRCNMRGHGDPWCPACAHHVRVQLDERRDGVDLDAPYAAFAPMPDVIFDRTRPQIITEAWDSLGVGQLELSLDGQHLGSGFRNLAVTLVPEAHDGGTHRLSLTATDALGHSATVTSTFVIDHTPDTLAPTVMFVGTEEVVRRLGTVRAEVIDDRDEQPLLSAVIDSATSTPVAALGFLANNYDITINAPDGRHTVALRATDAWGNRGSAERTMMVVGTATPAVWLSPAAGERLLLGDVPLELTVARSVVEVALLANGKTFSTLHPDNATAVHARWNNTAFASETVTLTALTRNAAGDTLQATRSVSVAAAPLRRDAVATPLELPAAPERRGCSASGAEACAWALGLMLAALRRPHQRRS